MDLPPPKTALIVLVGRGGDFVAPNGSTMLETGDTLLVLAGKDDVPPLRALVEPPP